MEKPAPPGVLEDASQVRSISRPGADASPGRLGDVPGTDWQRWLDKKQVKYFNKRTFVTTITTPREVRDAEARFVGAQASPEPNGNAREEQQGRTQRGRRPTGRESLLQNVRYATVHGGFFYCSASRRQVLKNARLLLRPSWSTYAAMVTLTLRACLNAAYTLDATYIAAERWEAVTVKDGGSGSIDANVLSEGQIYAISELVAVVVECVGVWMRIIVLGALLAALAAKVWCNRGFLPQVSLTITAYRTTTDIAAFSFLHYMPTLDHLRILLRTVTRLRRAAGRTREDILDFQTDCDSRLLTDFCVKWASLVLTLASVAFACILISLHVAAPVVVLMKMKNVALVFPASVADWRSREWLAVIGLANQIFSTVDADEQRKKAMLRLLLAPHDTADADAISLQSVKLDAFEVSLVEALTEDMRELDAVTAPIRPIRPDCIVQNSCAIDVKLPEAAVSPESESQQLTDDAVLSEELTPVSSTSLATFLVMTMRSTDMETVLRRVAHRKDTFTKQV